MPRLESLAAGLQRTRVFAVQLLPDALMVAGAGSIAYAAWLLHPAAGFAVGGGFSLGVGILASNARKDTA